MARPCEWGYKSDGFDVASASAEPVKTASAVNEAIFFNLLLALTRLKPLKRVRVNPKLHEN